MITFATWLTALYSSAMRLEYFFAMSREEVSGRTVATNLLRSWMSCQLSRLVKLEGVASENTLHEKVSAIPLMWNSSTGSSRSLICVYKHMVLKVKCASLTRTLDEEKSLILEREERFVAQGAKRHFLEHYSWHLAPGCGGGHSKEHSPSAAVKRVGPSNATSSRSEQSKAMGKVNTHRVLWWPEFPRSR